MKKKLGQYVRKADFPAGTNVTPSTVAETKVIWSSIRNPPSFGRNIITSIRNHVRNVF